MTQEHPTLGSTRSTTRRRRIWLLTSLLLAATLAAGAATQRRAAGGGGTAIAAGGRSNGAVRVSGEVDRTAVMLGGDGLVRMELVLQAEDRSGDAVLRRPTDLVIVLDRSGSMQGRKIEDARAAVRQLVSQLGADDRFALVAFESRPQLAIPLAHATPRAAGQWSRAIAGIGAGGGTNMEPALDLAFDTLESARADGREPRVILISDGRASEPDTALVAQARRAARGEFALSAVGIGADFNENLMANLSDAGTGNYYYLADAADLASVFANEFASARETVASGLVVTVRPADGVTVVDAAGYPLETTGNAFAFRPGSLYAGQQRHVWVTYRVPTQAERSSALGAVELAYSDGGAAHSLVFDELPRIATVAEEKDFFANLDVDRWSQSVVVEEYNDLAQRVAGYVQAGRREEARQAVAEFRDRNTQLNAVAASPAVAQQLAESESLERSIDEAFEGRNQARKRNHLGKALHADAYSKRRVGSRK